MGPRLDDSILVSDNGVFPLRLINHGLSDLYVIKGEKVAWVEEKHPMMGVNMLQASTLKSEENSKNSSKLTRIEKGTEVLQALLRDKSPKIEIVGENMHKFEQIICDHNELFAMDENDLEGH